ncbi:MAG: carboxypeptidase-like regulatory domain-containing protein [Ignavibacteriales bacterium]|nr:carboxypeptidase-like regulatory domain-containing protein [Ignavibacteriales bacterium]
MNFRILLLFFAWFITFLLPMDSFSQFNPLVNSKDFALYPEVETGNIQGYIYDEKGIAIPNANIIILENLRGTTSDEKGRFLIKNIAAGNYNIKISHIAFETLTKNIIITSDQTTEMNIQLKSTSFLIGGIEVIASSELIPTEAASKTYIYGGEIEHYQASSVKDVLDLVPGIQKTDNSNLGKFSQAAIRGDETDKLSSLGTFVMVDGMPISNNANMQFERMQNINTGISNLGGGVDLRTIPADNIESIEVVSGLPSVKYGDLTEGLINIKTKTGIQKQRLKIKNNPDTRELNLGGGFSFQERKLNYNFNFARSERDVRKVGDEYSRLTGQLIFSNPILIDNLSVNHKVGYQIIFDEEEPKGDVYRIKNYNRGFDIGYSTWGKYFLTEDKSNNIEFNGYINLRKENSMMSRLIQSDLRILPNGDTVSSYIGKVETKGNEWLVGANLTYNNYFFTGDFLHRILAGTELRYETNTGKGIVFDTLFSYYGVESGKRPYSYENTPKQILFSLFTEDIITGKFPFDFDLTIGFRYEMYRPTSFNISGIFGNGDLVQSKHGSFFNPRLSLFVPLSEFNQLRINYGTTSKSPALNYLYLPEDVLKWRNPNNNSIVYLRYNRFAPDLKGFKEKQLEISYDQKFREAIGVTLSFYYKERRNEFEEQPIPVFVNTIVNGVEKNYYIDNYAVIKNLGWTISKGIEFILKTKKIEPLNMTFQVVGSYSFLNRSRNGFEFDPSPNILKGQIPNYKPTSGSDTLIGFVFPPKGSWSDRLQFNYLIRYTLPKLGLWVTFRAEQIVFERNQFYSLEPMDFTKLNTSEQLNFNFDREMRRKNSKWLLDINISKSLFTGSEISFYVNNFIDDSAVWQYSSSPTTISEIKRNPPIYYGIEFSMILEDLF